MNSKMANLSVYIKKTEKIFVFNICFLFMIFAGFFYLHEKTKIISIIIFLISISIILFVDAIDGSLVKKIRVNFWESSIWICLFLSMLLASLMNSDRYLFFGGVFFSLMFFSISGKSFEIKKSFIKKWLYLFFCFFTFLCISYGEFKFPFFGFFGNPNSIGVTFCTFFCFFSYFCAVEIEEETVDVKNLLVMFFSLVFVIASQARSALIVCLIIEITNIFVIIGLLSKINYIHAIKNNKKLNVLLSINAIFITVSVYFLIEFFILKTIINNESSSIDISSGRLDIWMYIINNSSLFGGGREALSEIGVGAHNTYLSLLAQYGWIVFLFSLLAFWGGALLSLNRSRKKNNFEIYALIGFFPLSMVEGMLMQPLMIWLFIHLMKATQSNE